MNKVLVMHGPNLNFLGLREPELYGDVDLNTINKKLELQAKELGLSLQIIQSNNESDLIAACYQAKQENTNYIILNPGALTHTSIALLDALQAVAIPFIEVHLTNIYSRETYRHKSFFSSQAIGVISGFNEHSYYLALQAINQRGL